LQEQAKGEPGEKKPLEKVFSVNPCSWMNLLIACWTFVARMDYRSSFFNYL